MKSYEKEVQQHFLDNEKKVLKRLEQNYKEALADIDDKIAILLGRDDKDLSNVIYQRQHQEALKTQIQAILEMLQANEFETVSEYLANAYTDGYVGAMYSINKQGIPLIVPIDQKQVVEAIQHETKLSEGLYTSMGKDIKKLQKNIASEISRGIASGLGYAEIARNIAFQANIPKNRAMTIAKTESHRIQCKATFDAQHVAKDNGADVLKQWDSTLDGDTRKSHRKLDGQIRELDERFEVDGKEARFPGDFGRPEEDINCRCVLKQRARWNLDEDELNKLKERAKFFGLDKTKDFEDYKKKYLKAAETESVQQSAQKINNKVIELQEYTINGNTYKVDGKHVILKNTKHEKEVAELIGKELKKVVSLVPRIVYPQGISTPDYIIGDEKYDLKEPIGTGKNVIFNMVHKKKSQANNFIFDISKCPLDYETIAKQIEGIYTSSHTLFINEIIVIKDGKIIKIFDRNK